MKRADGELLVRGPTGFLGYRSQPERSREILDDAGWMHTGDLCEIYDNGYVAIIGRKKDVLVTSGGKNISPELIENKLKASPYISEAVVIGEGRHFLSCLIELNGDAVGDLLQGRGIAYSTLRDMATNPAVSMPDAGFVRAAPTGYCLVLSDDGSWIARAGGGIVSTVPGFGTRPKYASYSGTSMATPHVSGAVAMYKAANPSATAADIKAAILGQGTATASLSGKTLTGKRLNVSGF